MSLQDVMTSKRYNFLNLSMMYEFLSTQGEKNPLVDIQREEALFE